MSPRARPLVLVGALVLLAGACAQLLGLDVQETVRSACTSDSDCKIGRCETGGCRGGECTVFALPDGTRPPGISEAGCDGAVCRGGKLLPDNKPVGAPCGKGLFCSEDGVCANCVGDDSCPAPDLDEDVDGRLIAVCTVGSCDPGTRTCGSKPSPPGRAPTDDRAGDCQHPLCDGSNVEPIGSEPDATDTPKPTGDPQVDACLQFCESMDILANCELDGIFGVCCKGRCDTTGLDCDTMSSGVGPQ